jgi:hypothetical protein
MKICDNSCANLPIWYGSKKTIGDFADHILHLGKHKPFRRALSYQAYQAYLKFSHVPTNLKPFEFGSENGSEYFKQRKFMRDNVVRDIKIEKDDEESSSSSEAASDEENLEENVIVSVNDKSVKYFAFEKINGHFIVAAIVVIIISIVISYIFFNFKIIE